MPDTRRSRWQPHFRATGTQRVAKQRGDADRRNPKWNTLITKQPRKNQANELGLWVRQKFRISWSFFQGGQ